MNIWHILYQFWRRKWQATPVFLPGKPHGQRSLAGYSPWGCKESDMTEQLHFLSVQFSHSVMSDVFNISPFNEHSGLISLRIDWLDLLAVQWTLKSLLHHRSSKVSILWHSAFFMVQLSHPYMTTGKTIALTRWTIVGKVMSLLFNMLSRLVITFL